MRICMPTMTDAGLGAPLHGHFGSAAYFTIVDTETDEIRITANADRHQAHGQCHPLSVLAGERFEAVLTGGMGRRAVASLNQAGIRVYQLGGATVGEAVDAMRAGKAVELTPATACGHGHGHGHGAGPAPIRGRGRGQARDH